MDYSIIIPYHSNSNYLYLCLNSLEKTVPEDVEMIVVINNTKAEDRNISINTKRFKVLREERNLGYSNAINLGAKNARGKYLIFCDSDTIYLQPEWFYNLTNFFISNTRIGIASSKLINPSTNRIIDFGMALSKYNNAHPFLDRPINFKPTLFNRRVQMACSANMIIERKVFEEIGMMDTDLINYYQDNDICLRLKDINKECWVVANSIVYHKGISSSINKESYRPDIKGYYMAKNFHRMDFDLDEYFKINFQHFTQLSGGTGAHLKYLLVDLSTVADGKWFYDCIKQYFPLYDVYELKHKTRDAEHIPMLDLLGLNVLRTEIPIAYFTDRYISLNGNSLWSQLRDCSSDIIIDRNSNIVSFVNLKES